jgi:molybdopterin/thiamine biosynthesis adenylyltransferase
MHRPKVKPDLPIELDDEQGRTGHLLGLLDGTRTRADVVRRMRAFDPAVTDDEVTASIDRLAEAGYLEDAALDPPVGVFSPAEATRYQRNFEFLSYFPHPTMVNYDFQARLKKSRVTIIGGGGLGSYTALALTAMGVGELYLVDHDTVEPANLSRQVLCTSDDIGTHKVDAAARRLREINPHVRVEPVATRIDGPDSARKYLAGRDIVVCAADRPRLRVHEWVNAAALAEGVPWIRAGNDGLTLSAFLHVPYLTACFDCVQTTGAEEVPWYTPFSRYTAEDLPDTSVNPGTAPVAGLVGSIVAVEATKHLTGAVRPAIHDRRLIFDLARMEITFADGKRRSACPSCGTDLVSTSGTDAVARPS